MKRFLKNIYEATGPKRAAMDVCLVGAALCIGVSMGMSITMKAMNGGEK